MSEPLTALTDPAALGEMQVLPDDPEPTGEGLTDAEADALLAQPVPSELDTDN